MHSSVGKAWDYESKVCEFDARCGQVFFFILYFSLSLRSFQPNWAHTNEIKHGIHPSV